VDKLAIAWVWEAFDNHRYVGTGGAKTPDGFKATPLMVGGRLFVRTAFSGVAALDPASGELIDGDIAAQTRRVLVSAGAILRAAGADFEHVVLVQSFIKKMDDWPAYHEVYLEFFDEHRPPPRFTVTADLAAPELLIEIQMIAAVPNG